VRGWLRSVKDVRVTEATATRARFFFFT
jgi:hypothetical protein